MLPPSWKAEAQKAIEETANADREQRKAEQSDAASQIAAAINALRDAQQTQTRHEDTNEKINVGLAIVTIVLVFLTVIFTGLSWSAFRAQLHEMQTAGIQTNRIIEATTEQAKAATENAKTTRDSYIASQRAWVGPTTARITGDFALDKPLKTEISFLNTGREPAINFIDTADIFESTPTEDANGISMAKINAFFKGCREANAAQGGTVVFPSSGGISPSGQTLTITKPASFLNQSMIAGDSTIIIDGCFVYRSIDVIRHSYFCYFYRGNVTDRNSLSICENGNGAD